MTENMMHTVSVEKIKEECIGVKTIFFKINLQKPKPGQFLMVWVPGIDEIPMSVSSWDKNGYWSVTVKNIGECTKCLTEVKIGDYIGIRGPLGTNFTIPKDSSKNILLIGGGIGVAPLKFLAEELMLQKRTFTFIEGAKSESQVIFRDTLQINEKVTNELIFCTDDGSFGIKAFAPEVLKDYLANLSNKHLENLIIYTCGPEKMMYKVYELCKEFNLNLQASLERFMRCGCGICGLCAVDPLGLLVCKDGPIFSYDQLEKMEDFGKYRRDFTGKKIKIE